MQVFWLAFGLIALALGVVGIVTPLLPTVPFLLLAALGFSRSSERLHRWLLGHPVLGQPIADWQSSGAIRRRAKWLASGSMLGVLILSVAFGLRPGLVVVQAVALCVIALFIWTRPEA
ncbi:MAG: hypothetical protein AUK60_04650 [Rhodobacteraceae bacterium CG2_30_10_405]|nr:DUF454 domain-containing protein [Rhodobacterales bacterium]NCO16270.1 DUF454 domain-containing protein [Alphaproteobacteria bacterium]OIQ06881.1 MAG: hypothetical protein AUK60_04650 [Rhodobacteraceae bacterium CG2_30_10_405]